MTSLSHAGVQQPPGLLGTCFRRQRALTWYGLVLLVLLVPLLLAAMIDPRLIDGVSVWAKPAKFFLSVAIYVFTFAWFTGYVTPEKRNSRLLRNTAMVVIVTSAFELIWITWQGAHGLRSHFNEDTLFLATMYVLMGLFVTVLIAALAPLAHQIWRHPRPGLQPEFQAAVIIGLILTMVLGGGLGGYMSQQHGHSVGVNGGHVLLFGWNRLGGDLRVGHFFGIHAEQAIPLLGALVARWAPLWRRIALIAGSIAYTVLTLGLFVQALRWQPLFPL
jgi:hypothetical protein